MPYSLDNRLVIGVASSAMFDLVESDGVFRSQGESLSPGGGIFKMHARDPFDFDWWTSEIARAKAFDWSTLEF